MRRVARACLQEDGRVGLDALVVAEVAVIVAVDVRHLDEVFLQRIPDGGVVALALVVCGSSGDGAWYESWPVVQAVAGRGEKVPALLTRPHEVPSQHPWRLWCQRGRCA